MRDTSVVSKYFAVELEALGYPVDKVYWSLNYCQGDGMATYGTGGDIKKLAHRLLDTPQKKAAITRAEDKGAIVLNIEGSSGHYHHWNTMRPVIERDESGEEKEDHADIKEMIAGKYGFCNVRVVITDEDGDELGFGSCGSVSDDKELAHVREIATDCLSDAKRQAKEKIEALASRVAAVAEW
jgi:hypothetical protein